MDINKEFIDKLLEQAAANSRLRQNFDLRTSPADGSQRMLNALLPGTGIPIHRHPVSSESVICLQGRFYEVLYDDDCNETARFLVCPSDGNFGCQVPAGVWHTVEVCEPSVIYETKDGRYGEDGSETFEEFNAKQVHKSEI